MSLDRNLAKAARMHSQPVLKLRVAELQSYLTKADKGMLSMLDQLATQISQRDNSRFHSVSQLGHGTSLLAFRTYGSAHPSADADKLEIL